MTTKPIITQYQKEDEYGIYYSFKYSHKTGTPVEYHIKMESSSLDTIKDFLLPALTKVLNKTIHPVVSTFYSTERQGKPLRFDTTMIDLNNGKGWVLMSIPLTFANHMFTLQVTNKNSYLTYETENKVKNVTVTRFEQQFVDGSSINIKVNMHKPVDNKYPVTYKYTKCVESTFDAIQEGCVDLLGLHHKHIMIDVPEWTTLTK